MGRPRSIAFVALVRALRGARRTGGAGLAESLRALPRWVAATLTGRYDGTSRRQLATLALALVYVVSPVDLLPELVLPLVGLADDALVLTWLAGRLVQEAGAFLAWERSAGSPGEAQYRPGAARQRTVRGHVVR